MTIKELWATVMYPWAEDIWKLALNMDSHARESLIAEADKMDSYHCIHKHSLPSSCTNGTNIAGLVVKLRKVYISSLYTFGSIDFSLLSSNFYHFKFTMIL